jgi:hypothetical protein
VTTQPRPSLSVMTPPDRQNLAAERLLSPTRTCPSLNWPREPDSSPEAVRWKQQLSLRPTRALAPAARDAIAMKVFIVAGKCNKVIELLNREKGFQRSKRYTKFNCARNFFYSTRGRGRGAFRPQKRVGRYLYSLALLSVTGQTSQPSPTRYSQHSTVVRRNLPSASCAKLDLLIVDD